MNEINISSLDDGSSDVLGSGWVGEIFVDTWVEGGTQLEQNSVKHKTSANTINILELIRLPYLRLDIEVLY